LFETWNQELNFLIMIFFGNMFIHYVYPLTIQYCLIICIYAYLVIHILLSSFDMYEIVGIMYLLFS
jgi:hypothetical protein